MERLDIIQWSENTATFVAASLSPAKEINVVLDEKKKTAVALVPDDQLSLAIGKDGQNVRLAVKLTGWKIDIKGKTEAASEEKVVRKPKTVRKISDKKQIKKKIKK